MSVSVKLLQAASGGGASDAAWLAEIGPDTPDYDIRGAIADDDDNIYVSGRHNITNTSYDRMSLIKLDRYGNFVSSIEVPTTVPQRAFIGRPAYANNNVFFAGHPDGGTAGRRFHKYGTDFSSSTADASDPADTDRTSTNTQSSTEVHALTTSGRVAYSCVEGTATAAVWILDQNLNSQKCFQAWNASNPTIWQFRKDSSDNMYLTLQESSVGTDLPTTLKMTASGTFVGGVTSKSPVYYHFAFAADSSGNPYFGGQTPDGKFIAKYPNVFGGSYSAHLPTWAFYFSGITSGVYDLFYDSTSGYIYAVAYGSSKLKILTLNSSNGSVIRSQEMDSPSGNPPQRGGSTLVEGEYLLIPMDDNPNAYLLKYPVGGVVPGTYDGVTFSDYTESLTDISGEGIMEIIVQIGAIGVDVDTQTSESKTTDSVISNDSILDSTVTPVTSN